MRPLGVSISDVTYVDFQRKKMLYRHVTEHDQMNLLRAGLINYQRLMRRAWVELVTEEKYGTRYPLTYDVFDHTKTNTP